MTTENRIQKQLDVLYGKGASQQIWVELNKRLQDFKTAYPVLPDRKYEISEKDIVLITYSDQFTEANQAPLQSLDDLLNRYLLGVINSVHILPFFPYSSDDGFSVIDFKQVDQKLGNWHDVQNLANSFRLMVDLVINHVSRQSDWFQKFLQGDKKYRDFFITAHPDTDLSKVVRPRALPLLTKVQTYVGEKYVWTTFSTDQIDLNYKNPEVMIEVIDVLLCYVANGAEIIRLDAIAYLWKEIGTSCIHLPQTHAVVKLLRAILDDVAPGVILITETNVPHQENVSYFGSHLEDNEQGGDEAQLVYQFPLAPLVLHTFYSGDVTALREWASDISTPYLQSHFFNFIASHDGIGIRPVEGLLTQDQIQDLVNSTLQHGGQVSYRSNPDGSKSVYELNITLYDALNDPKYPIPDVDLQRFLASQAIMISLAGIPGVYVHSLFGSANCERCVTESGQVRSINREKFDLEKLELEINNPASRKAQIFDAYRELLRIRCNHDAFHPQGEQRIHNLGKEIFAITRVAPDKSEYILCLVNISDTTTYNAVHQPTARIQNAPVWVDLIAGGEIHTEKDSLLITLRPYQYVWLVPVNESIDK